MSQSSMNTQDSSIIKESERETIMLLCPKQTGEFYYELHNHPPFKFKTGTVLPNLVSLALSWDLCVQTDMAQSTQLVIMSKNIHIYFETLVTPASAWPFSIFEGYKYRLSKLFWINIDINSILLFVLHWSWAWVKNLTMHCIRFILNIYYSINKA